MADNEQLQTDLLGRQVVRVDGLKRGVVRTAYRHTMGVTYQVETEDGSLEDTDLSRMAQWKLVQG
jgi:hypothetical protein